MDAGADICVVSVHKMGMGFEQGSVYHLQGDLVDPVRLKQCSDLLSTTSASTLIYAAMDGWRRQMAENGEQLLSRALDLARETRSLISEMPELHVLDSELVRAEASHRLDPLHILVDVSLLGISGYQASSWLRDNAGLALGISDHRRIEVTLSMADDESTVQRLMEALHSLRRAAKDMRSGPEVLIPEPGALEMPSVTTPREAFFSADEAVPVGEAAGRVAAEQITPYPPGIPAVVPGEIINQAVVDYLRSGVEAGMLLVDPADPKLGTIRVVR
jgi:arginine decarboxylase